MKQVGHRLTGGPRKWSKFLNFGPNESWQSYFTKSIHPNFIRNSRFSEFIWSSLSIKSVKKWWKKCISCQKCSICEVYPPRKIFAFSNRFFRKRNPINYHRFQKYFWVFFSFWVALFLVKHFSLKNIFWFLLEYIHFWTTFLPFFTLFHIFWTFLSVFLFSRRVSWI